MKRLKVAILFPGQGLNPNGDGIETLIGQTPGLDRIVSLTKQQTINIIGDDLFAKVTSSTKEERTGNTVLGQLAAAHESTLLARGLLHYKPSAGAPSLAELYIKRSRKSRRRFLGIAVAGHSVGAIAAAGLELVVSPKGELLGASNYERSLRIILERAGLMQAYHLQHPGAHSMYAVVTTNGGDSLCRKLIEFEKQYSGADSSIVLSGHNAPNVHTLAGNAEAVQHAISCLEKVKTFKLSDYPFHDKAAMHGIALALRAFLNEKDIGFNPYFKVVSSRNANAMGQWKSLRTDIWRGVEEPVMWHCDGGDMGKHGKDFVIGSLISRGYNVHIVLANEMAAWERNVQRQGLADVIAVTDYESLVAGHRRIMELAATARKAIAVPYLRPVPAGSHGL